MFFKKWKILRNFVKIWREYNKNFSDINPGIHFSTDETTLQCTTPVRHDGMRCSATFTQQYRKCASMRHVRSWSEIVVLRRTEQRIAKAVYTECALNNAQVDGPITFRSGCAVHEHVHSVCLKPGIHHSTSQAEAARLIDAKIV